MLLLLFVCLFFKGTILRYVRAHGSFFFFNFIYLWLCWVFVSVRGLSLVVASGGHSSSWCAGLSLSWPLLLRTTGSRRAGSVIVAHGPSCSTACGIFPDQGSNRVPCIGRQTLNHCATREVPTYTFTHINPRHPHGPPCDGGRQIAVFPFCT